MYGYGTDMSWWMVVASVLWFGLLAVAVAAAVVWIRRRSATEAAADPRRILEQRLARGDIDDDEFQRRIRALAASAP